MAGMREEKNGQNGWSNLSNHLDTAYYLQDELGSPIRLLDEEGNMRETYGYDEFGQNLYRKQGQIQPFGYTGYQSDRIAGTYYAQAREYRAELGRFAGVDIIKGFAAAPYTLNECGYCWGNPMVLVDLDGAWPKWIETATKVVTVTVAVVAVAGAVAATGGVGVVLGVVAGAAVGGVVNGFVNEANGGSYINGWVGGAVSGGMQTLGGLINPVIFVLAGSANGLASIVTDRLDNWDPTNDKYKTKEEIFEDARINAIKGMAYSIPGALMGWFTNFANVYPSVVNELMKGYNYNFGNALNQFYGIIDNLLLGKDSLDEKNNRTYKD